MGDPILEFGSSRFVAPLRLHFGGSKAANKIESLCLRQKMYHCASVSFMSTQFLHKGLSMMISMSLLTWSSQSVSAHLRLLG